VQKTCPRCSADVVEAANLCKHCFHDFRATRTRGRSPAALLLGALALTGLVAGLGFSSLRDRHRALNVHADEETRRIVFVTTTPDGRTVDQVSFDDVAAVEYDKNADGLQYEIAVSTTDGRRHVLRQDDQPLDAVAETYATMLGRKVMVKGEADVAKLGQ
jgi:hypothetical protein